MPLSSANKKLRKSVIVFILVQIETILTQGLESLMPMQKMIIYDRMERAPEGYRISHTWTRHLSSFSKFGIAWESMGQKVKTRIHIDDWIKPTTCSDSLLQFRFDAQKETK